MMLKLLLLGLIGLAVATKENGDGTGDPMMDIEKLQKAMHVKIRKIEYHHPGDDIKVDVNIQKKSEREEKNDTALDFMIQEQIDMSKKHGPPLSKKDRGLDLRYKNYIKHKYGGKDKSDTPTDLAFHLDNLPACDFENGWCDFDNIDIDGDVIDWKRIYAKNVTAALRPKIDSTNHPLRTGHYLCADASEMSNGTIAVLGPKTYIRPNRTATRFCLKLYFSTQGTHLGDFRVFIGYRNPAISLKLVWETSNITGQFWQLINLEIYGIIPHEDFYFLIVAVHRHNFVRGGFYVDDILFTEGACFENQCDPWEDWMPWSKCSQSCGGGNKARRRTRVGGSCESHHDCQSRRCNNRRCPPRSGSCITCDFESSCPEVKNNNNYDFLWRSNSGTTPTSGTGPSNDATISVCDGHYWYAEASGQGFDDLAVFYLDKLYTDSTICLTFSLHMQGRGMGRLSQFMYYPVTRNVKVMWSLLGDQGHAWYRVFSSDVTITWGGHRGVQTFVSCTGYTSNIGT